MAEAKASASTPALRPGAQVHAALQQSFCRFKHHVCGMPRLEGYDYCQRHILEDKNAPYKLCSYVYQVNGQQCNQPAHRGERRSNGYYYTHTSPSPPYTLIIHHLNEYGSKCFYFEEEDGRKRSTIVLSSCIIMLLANIIPTLQFALLVVNQMLATWHLYMLTITIIYSILKNVTLMSIHPLEHCCWIWSLAEVKISRLS